MIACLLLTVSLSLSISFYPTIVSSFHFQLLFMVYARSMMHCSDLSFIFVLLSRACCYYYFYYHYHNHYHHRSRMNRFILEFQTFSSLKFAVIEMILLSRKGRKKEGRHIVSVSLLGESACSKYIPTSYDLV